MATLTRLHDFETDRDATPPVAISATKVDAEFDQLITESNAQDVRLDTLEAAGNVETSDIADDAVTGAKISFIDDSIAVTDTAFMIADGTDYSAFVLSGDVTCSNAGVVTIASSAVETSMINDDAVTGAKISFIDDSIAATDTAFMIADGTDYSAFALSGDVTCSNAGVVAIASGVIVDADINASAAIDATKIHDGSVSNAEFGYLDGVASGIQTQIDALSSGSPNWAGLTDNAATVSDSLVYEDADDSSNSKKDTIDDILALYDSKTSTLTNKTFDANATGNSLSNVDVADLASGTDGELITWGADALPTTVATGSSGQVLTSNGTGAAPTFQTAPSTTKGFAIAMAVAL